MSGAGSSNSDGRNKRKNLGSPFLSPLVAQPNRKISNLRRSMITSTPAHHKHPSQHLVPKPTLSPIMSAEPGRNKENVDLTMSEYQYGNDSSQDLFANDTPTNLISTNDEEELGAGDDEDVVEDSVIEGDSAPVISARPKAGLNLDTSELRMRRLNFETVEDSVVTESDDEPIFTGHKSRLNLDTTAPAYHTPRRVVIDSDSEGEKDSRADGSSDSESETGTEPLDDQDDDDSVVAESDDEPIFTGHKSRLNLDTTTPAYHTPRRVVIDSDSEGEKDSRADGSSDSESETGTEPVDDQDDDDEVVPIAQTINETIDLTEPASTPPRLTRESPTHVGEDQTMDSSKQTESVASSVEAEQSLDDSIQVLEVIKPSPRAAAEIEKRRVDLQSRLKALQGMASTNLNALPDKGARIMEMIASVQKDLSKLPPKPEIVEVIPPMFNRMEDSGSSRSSGSSRGPEIIPPPKMTSNEMERLVSADKGKRLFGGKMTDNRLDNVYRVTGDAIDKIYKSLTSAPETEEIDTPKGVKIPLMRHQKLGLAWMLWREKQIPPGGILADDMGLGKTLSMISLIMHQKNAREERARANDEEDPERKKDLLKSRIAKEKRLVPSNATLVIAPASLIMQWEDEIKRRVKAAKLDVLVYHGPKNKREKNPRRLATYDVVITTYNLAATELVSKDLIDDEADEEQKGRRKFNDSSVLAQVLWDRVILDEAHQIKNRTSNASRACCRLSAINRWCLTGTPIHNELWDLFSLIRFLRVTPFDEEKLWKEYIMTGRHGAERLNTLVKGLLLRRTKAQIDTETQKPLVELKPREFTEVEVVLEGLEMKVYQQMFLASQQQVKQLLTNQEDMERYGMIRRQKNNGAAVAVQNPFMFNSQNTIAKSRDNFQRMNCILVVLLKLRQACVHLALTRAHIDLDAFDTLGGENDPTADLNRELAEMSIAGDELAKQISLDGAGGDISEQVEALFEERFKSAKIKALLKELDKVIDMGDKCVIVSQWTSMLNIVERHLKRRDVRYTSITGAIPTKDRQARVDSFNMPDGEGAQVMLLSLTAGGVGLNLIGGNHLFLLDLHWNPALENQACDRIYRMGQKKNVYIHKFICKDTIEQRVLELQKKKLELADGVLEGAGSKKLTKLNINDLKFLFDLNKPVEREAASSGRPY
ncbi:hypothetical protein QR680_014339 [Steinernema hermaphroditum]|uniref:Helicase ATP-binding domain-containing protein n=1 Tax=Steinernema hermaphroditum TaxID=289476 RepID=A0AA39IB62_9BILA|nr:hypothetical protein QR680_014339 [Steinernema hermaphroditum]